MKIWFNHLVLATVAIVFIVTSANAKNATQNLVSNNQSSTAKSRESMANNANSMTSIEDMASARLHRKGKKSMIIINPVRRNQKQLLNSKILCKDLGFTITSTGECKPTFVEE